jgi:hypothetical protein
LENDEQVKVELVLDEKNDLYLLVQTLLGKWLSDMNNIDIQIKYCCLVTEVNNKIGAIVVTYLASTNKIHELYENSTWYNPTLPNSENKHRMKTTGAAIIGYEIFLTELIIIALSKTIEDIILGIKEEFNVSYDIWKHNHITSIFHQEAKLVRALNNVIKHNNGLIEKSNEPSGKYLVNEFGYPDGCKVVDVVSTLGKSDYILEKTAQIYVYLLNLVAKIANQPVSPLADISDNMKERIIKRFIPDYLQISVDTSRLS